MENLKAVTDLARLKASILVGLAVILGQVVVLTGLAPFDQLILGFLVGFVLSASTNTINDVFDLELDRLEKPERPLPQAELSVFQAILLFAIETFLAILCSLFLNLPAFILTVFIAGISFMYSYSLKNYLLFKNTLTAFGVASAFLVGALSIGRILPLAVILFFFQIFITVVAFEVHKDIADVEGDYYLGKKTIATTFGTRKAAFLAVFLYSAAFLLFQGILIQSTSSLIGWLWIVDVLGTIIGFYFLFPIMREQDPPTIHRARKRIMATLGIFVVASILNFLG
ncbi:MAG: UbiA family prenyltransferase [Candidatus Heimdallarchaeota archaeon]